MRRNSETNALYFYHREREKKKSFPGNRWEANTTNQKQNETKQWTAWMRVPLLQQIIQKLSSLKQPFSLAHNFVELRGSSAGQSSSEVPCCGSHTCVGDAIMWPRPSYTGLGVRGGSLTGLEVHAGCPLGTQPGPSDKALKHGHSSMATSDSWTPYMVTASPRASVPRTR